MLTKKSEIPEVRTIADLITALDTAVGELEGKTEEISPFSHYASFKEFDNHLRLQIKKIKMRDATDFKEVSDIFLPTSDWDDIGGPEAIVKEILRILKTIKLN